MTVVGLPRRRGSATGTMLLAALCLIGAVACGNREPTNGVTGVEAAASPTLDVTTSSSTTTTTSTTTSTTTTTTLPRQLTLPVAPPADPRGPENNPPIGRIEIPKIGLDAQLEEGIRLTTLDRGPGHWPGSALPGAIGNVVVAGHRTSHNAEFRHLDQLELGDEVVFTTDTGTHTYLVTGTQIVLPDALWITDPSTSQTATLFACHPVGSTAERIVVELVLSA